jgi:large subunit ribosomal protein L29
MKTSELKDLTLTELTSKDRDLRPELFNLKLPLVGSQLEKSSRIALVRKDIARIETCMTELRRAKATA